MLSRPPPAPSPAVDAALQGKDRAPRRSCASASPWLILGYQLRGWTLFPPRLPSPWRGKGMDFCVRSNTHQPKEVSGRLQTPVSPLRRGHAVVCSQRLPGFTGDKPVMLSDVSTKSIVSVSISFERGMSFGHLRTRSVYLAELSFSPLFGHILHQTRESEQLSPAAPTP